MKVAIIYPYIAHYRLPVFAELSRSKDIEYTIISGLDSKLSIKTVDLEFVKKLKEKNLKLLNVKNTWFFKEQCLWQKGLLSSLRKNNFDTIIFLGNPYYFSTWLGILYSKLKRKRVYLWTHGVTSDEIGIKWRVRKFFYNLSHGLLLYGHKAKHVMVKNGFQESNLHVIYNSLNYDDQIHFREKINSLDINQKKAELFKNSELPTIVFVGRLTSQKRLDMIIEAIKKLSEKNFRINTLFIGEGDISDQLKQSAKNYGLEEYFHFYGACYDESKLAELIGVCDICVSPGEVGLTAITALGYGIPVISHDNFDFQMPEYEAIIPGFNGNLFKHGSIEDLANKIEEWLSKNSNIPKSTIRKNCYEVVDQKYNPKNQVRIINEIVSEKR